MSSSGGVVDTGVVAFILFICIASVLFGILGAIHALLKHRQPRSSIEMQSPSDKRPGVAATVTPPRYRYSKREYLMSPPEREFYRRLFMIVGREYLIFPQIHLSSLFVHQIRSQNWRAALARIQRKSVDFVLCDTTFRPLCAIELDDRSHERLERQERDALVNHTFTEAGLPIIRIPTSTTYTNNQLDGIISYCINQRVSYIDKKFWQ